MYSLRERRRPAALRRHRLPYLSSLLVYPPPRDPERRPWADARPANFLVAIHMMPSSRELSLYLPVCFWTGLTLLGLISLAIIFLRHFLTRPRVSTSAKAST